MKRYYGPLDIALAVGQTRWTVCRFLREKHPAHERHVWWRFTREEFEAYVVELQDRSPSRRFGGRRLRRRTF